MTVNLHTFIGLYDHALVATAHLLDKGMEHAAAQGVSERDMLNWRLIEDMNPLAFQVVVVVNFSRQWPARVAGVAAPEGISADLDLAQLKDAIARARDFLATLTPDQFEGRDDIPLTYKIIDGFEPTLPSGQWLANFATTNIHFHLITAYGILRAHGVQIGKADLFAGGL